MSITIRANLHVIGRVQGVYYRASTAEAARGLGLTGWVRNREDGGVEAVVEGDRETVLRLVEWCRRGPPAARVDELRVHETTATGEFPTFAVRY